MGEERQAAWYDEHTIEQGKAVTVRRENISVMAGTSFFFFFTFVLVNLQYGNM